VRVDAVIHAVERDQPIGGRQVASNGEFRLIRFAISLDIVGYVVWTMSGSFSVN
jgi:hypothetical protein